MNRIEHLFASELPRATSSYDNSEAISLLWQYRRSPVELSCPRCRTESIVLLAFIAPTIDEEGYASVSEPNDDYAAALYCIHCESAIGLRSPLA